jgi:hypothetical protein
VKSVKYRIEKVQITAERTVKSKVVPRVYEQSWFQTAARVHEQVCRWVDQPTVRQAYEEWSGWATWL